jgi:uncharacterized protein (DUF2235 family)
MAKRIVLCADGTWNTPHGVDVAVNDTNVRKLYCGLSDCPDQLAYYDSGVGTDGTPIDHLIGGAMGEGLFQKIQDNYQYLAYVWDPGDDIFLFGFSRGAYTARSLGGMIARFGVPTKNFDNMMVKRIFDAYRLADAAQKDAAKASLKAEYGLTDVTVKMVGVWDTVGSLGIPGIVFSIFDQKRYGFLDTTLHPSVEKAYHAVCIDERRAQFMPTLWTNADGSYRANDNQLQQVWFSGVHCDVGGSYAETQLSDITMSWMMNKAIACGLTFKDAAMKQYVKVDAANATGRPLHDEWKLVPWGIPTHRTVPPNAVLSNSVQLRLDGVNEYQPEKLNLNGRKLMGYGVEVVV